MFTRLVLNIKKYFRQETSIEMRDRIYREIRQYNTAGLASIKFYQGERNASN